MYNYSFSPIHHLGWTDCSHVCCSTGKPRSSQGIVTKRGRCQGYGWGEINVLYTCTCQPYAPPLSCPFPQELFNLEGQLVTAQTQGAVGIMNLMWGDKPEKLFQSIPARLDLNNNKIYKSPSSRKKWLLKACTMIKHKQHAPPDQSTVWKDDLLVFL